METNHTWIKHYFCSKIVDIELWPFRQNMNENGDLYFIFKLIQYWFLNCLWKQFERIYWRVSERIQSCVCACVELLVRFAFLWRKNVWSLDFFTLVTIYSTSKAYATHAKYYLFQRQTFIRIFLLASFIIVIVITINIIDDKFVWYFFICSYAVQE